MSKQVLIVEDEFPQRHVLHEKLSKAGFDTLEARNGREGLEVALRMHPDAIILDLLMPRMNGLDMLKQLRMDEWGKKVPVLILSNLQDVEKIQKVTEDEVWNYFVKSDTSLDRVVSKVTELVG